jgi:hypothetical protein
LVIVIVIAWLSYCARSLPLVVGCLPSPVCHHCRLPRRPSSLAVGRLVGYLLSLFATVIFIIIISLLPLLLILVIIIAISRLPVGRQSAVSSRGSLSAVGLFISYYCWLLVTIIIIIIGWLRLLLGQLRQFVYYRRSSVTSHRLAGSLAGWLLIIGDVIIIIGYCYSFARFVVIVAVGFGYLLLLLSLVIIIIGYYYLLLVIIICRRRSSLSLLLLLLLSIIIIILLLLVGLPLLACRHYCHIIVIIGLLLLGWLVSLVRFRFAPGCRFVIIIVVGSLLSGLSSAGVVVVIAIVIGFPRWVGCHCCSIVGWLSSLFRRRRSLVIAIAHVIRLGSLIAEVVTGSPSLVVIRSVAGWLEGWLILRSIIGWLS